MEERETEFLTARELADLLRVKQRKVYDLAASGEVPCSRVTGKLLFPRRAVDAWLATHGSGPVPRAPAPRPDVFLGSHDPLLEWALHESGSSLAMLFGGSLDGLTRFSEGQGCVAAMHLYDPDSDGWNRAAVAERFTSEPVVLIEFAWRARGLLVAPGMEREILDVADLRGRRVVLRQAGAGSQALMEHLLDRAGIAIAELEETITARTESDAAVPILEGKADAALGLQGVARRHQLGFVPLLDERFDLLVDRRSWFEPPLQAFAAFCRSDAFRAKAAEMHGYRVDGFGTVHFNGA